MIQRLQAIGRVGPWPRFRPGPCSPLYCSVTTALKFGRQKGLNNAERKTLPNHTRAKRQHVGVVVLTDHAGGKLIGTNATPDAFDLVGRHHDALPRAAHDDAKPTVAGGHTPRGGLAMHRIMRAFGCRRADIDHLPPKRGDMRGDHLAQRNGGVITGKNDAGVGGHGDLVPLCQSRCAACLCCRLWRQFHHNSRPRNLPFAAKARPKCRRSPASAPKRRPVPHIPPDLRHIRDVSAHSRLTSPKRLQ